MIQLVCSYHVGEESRTAYFEGRNKSAAIAKASNYFTKSRLRWEIYSMKQVVTNAATGSSDDDAIYRIAS